MKIRTRAYDEGFRRGGVAHSKEWKEWPGEMFSNEQIEAMHEEPRLMMQIIEEDGEDILGDELPSLNETAVTMMADLSPKDQLVAAALHAMAKGNIIATGKPAVDAMEATLGRSVTAEERDEAWEIAKAVKAENNAQPEEA